MQEIWKDVKGYENKYLVSNFGNIKNKSNNFILKPSKANKGYSRVCIRNNDNKIKTPYIHHLVATTFIPNPNNLPQINHINRNKN
jgi:hypothetical protein